eukprot:6159570-Amphidinium_carterae.1
MEIMLLIISIIKVPVGKTVGSEGPSQARSSVRNPTENQRNQKLKCLGNRIERLVSTRTDGVMKEDWIKPPMSKCVDLCRMACMHSLGVCT